MQKPVQDMFRLAGLGAMIAAALVLAGCEKKATASKVTADEMTMGPAAAKVTLIEYASVACPHCAEFNETVMPELKKKYIVPGKIKYVYRPMLTGVPTIAASGELLAQCAGKDKFFTVVDAIMRGQQEFYAQGETDALARPVLLRIAKSIGMDEDAFNTCVTDADALKTLDDANTSYLKNGIDSTPTFFLNDKKVDYKGGGIAEFDKAIADAQAAAK